MVADDSKAIQLLEEDCQADAMLKDFAKGTSVNLFPDSDANQLSMQSTMSPGRQVTRSFTAKGKKKKVAVPRKKKNNAPGNALPMFNDPVSSPVLPKYFAPQSTNLVRVALKPLEIVKRSKWLTMYPDPRDQARLALFKEASKTNYWYQFLYDIFVDGKLSRWGDRISNILSFLIKAEILKLTKVGIDLVPLMTYKFVFACVPCLWKTDLERYCLQVLVDAIKKIRI
jgi:hypothetical protein